MMESKVKELSFTLTIMELLLMITLSIVFNAEFEGIYHAYRNLGGTIADYSFKTIVHAVGCGMFGFLIIDNLINYCQANKSLERKEGIKD